MVVRLDIRHNIDEVRARIRSNRTDQLPYATAVALTRTAQKTQAFLTGRLPQLFDRPTPYTLRSLYIRPATKTRLVASVYIKDQAPKGTPASQYLQPEIEGGQRNLKRSESALRSAGLLPSGMMIVPGAGAEIDQYGNMKAGQIVAILSALNSLRGTPYTQAAHVKRAGRGKYRNTRYFIAQPGGHLAPGVYQRLDGHRVKPVMIFVRTFSYRPRFDFYGQGARYAASIFSSEFEQAWRHALATAR